MGNSMIKVKEVFGNVIQLHINTIHINIESVVIGFFGITMMIRKGLIYLRWHINQLSIKNCIAPKWKNDNPKWNYK